MNIIIWVDSETAKYESQKQQDINSINDELKDLNNLFGHEILSL